VSGATLCCIALASGSSVFFRPPGALPGGSGAGIPVQFRGGGGWLSDELLFLRLRNCRRVTRTDHAGSPLYCVTSFGNDEGLSGDTQGRIIQEGTAPNLPGRTAINVVGQRGQTCNASGPGTAQRMIGTGDFFFLRFLAGVASVGAGQRSRLLVISRVLAGAFESQRGGSGEARGPTSGGPAKSYGKEAICGQFASH